MKAMVLLAMAMLYSGCTGPLTGHYYTEEEILDIYEAGKYVHERVDEAKKGKDVPIR